MNLLPVIISDLTIVHIIPIDSVGGPDLLGISNRKKISSNPYHTVKDIYRIIILIIIFIILIFYKSNYLGHSHHYIEANPFKTPVLTRYQWYPLP